MPDAGATRVLQIALEVDQFGEDSQDAAQQLLDQGGLSDLMQWITDAPGRNAAAALRNYISSPIAIKATLLREPLDQVAARSLLTSLGEDSCDVLLEVLCDAEGRATRRLIYDRLREFGPALAPRLSQRLEGAPWYFVRNLLALMRDTAMVDGSTAEFAGAAFSATSITSRNRFALRHCDCCWRIPPRAGWRSARRWVTRANACSDSRLRTSARAMGRRSAS